MNTQTLRTPSRRPAVAPMVRGRTADPRTLFVLTIMSILTISTPSVELFGIPRITVVSVPFTMYMLISIRARINSDLLCFVFAYLVAFIPSTIFAAVNGGIRLNSVLQGTVGLLTLLVVGTYFFNWLVDTPIKRIAYGFKALTVIFLIFSAVELIFYRYFLNLRTWLYSSGGSLNDVGVVVSRELTLYGGRPSGLFSEPSHFARYLGLMMVAYVAATRRSVTSLWSSGAFLVATRSISYFFAFPAMLLELWRAMNVARDAANRRSGKRSGVSPIGAIVVIALALSGIYYTQSERISGALGGRANTSSAVTGDTSLNERIVIPAGYFFDGPRSLLSGLGPTPQDELQEYTLFATRNAYRYQLSSDYKSAISTTIFTVAGMGYVGVAIMFVLLFQLRGLFGVSMAVAYLFANSIASGYHSTTSLVPSGLMLGIMSFQRLQGLTAVQAHRKPPRAWSKDSVWRATQFVSARKVRRSFR